MVAKPILVVDDEKNIRFTIARSLEPSGMQVHTAVNGEEALQKLAIEDFALVFLDLRMPGMDGIEVLRRIRAGWPRTRVVILTAHGTVESAVDAMKLGATDFVQKPVSPAEIRDLVATVLSREELDDASAKDFQSLIQLTKRHINDGRFELAREAAQSAIAADPGNPESYNLLGALVEIMGDQLQAQKYYRAALDIDPTFKPAKSNLERATSFHLASPLSL